MNRIDYAIDKGSAALADLMTPERVGTAVRRAHSETAAAMTSLRGTSRTAGMRLAPPEAVPLLIALRAQLEERARRDAQGYSAYRWLWYLRRIPDALTEGSISTTAPYTVAVAEILTDQNRKEEPPDFTDRWMSFKTDEHVARHALMLVCRARAIFTIHRHIRTVSKGCALAFDHDGFPRDVCADGLMQSMRHYDERMSRSQTFLARAGTVLPMTPAWEDTSRALLGCFRIAPQVVEAPVALHGLDSMHVRARFKCVLISGDRLRAFNSRFDGQAWWSAEAMPLTLFLAASSELLFALPNAVASLAQFGYLTTGWDVVRRVWADHWNAATALTSEILGTPVTIRSPEELLAAVRQLRGGVWPLTAPAPIRGPNEVLALDISSATMHLRTAFAFPDTTGPAANVRSRHFEEEIQRLIDDSPWKPGSPVRALRGRTLRLNGQAITDIDALGERDGTLLLVSAKGRLYTALYDAGDHAQVRNAADTVGAAVERWREVVAVLKASPRGDNYDFTAVREFLGVVCTPQVVWVPPGEATAEIAPGLPAAASVEELERWLNVAVTL